MGEKSAIAWTDATWNPVTGCDETSPGCKNCYAKRIARRLGKIKRSGYDPKNPFKVKLHPDRLNEPLKWKKPSKIFVCSMGDLFHEDVPFEFIDKVFDVFDQTERHTYQILTKRPERMYKYYAERVGPTCRDYPNVWPGMTAENQEMFDKRWEHLKHIPAPALFISYEPALGPLVLPADFLERGQKVWVIVGGESGPGASPMHPDWVRKVRDDCKAAKVPFFFKQWGEWIPSDYRTFEEVQKEKHKYTGIARDDIKPLSADKIRMMYRAGKANAGSLLDGKEYKEFPGEGAE